ncbi:MAG TPA: hypothetical protein VGJ12_14215, partial [Gemmatimonadaceae bacterium]
MRSYELRHTRLLLFGAAILAAACARSGDKPAGADSTTKGTAATAACAGDNGGLTLPAGFCATIFADSLGHVRDLVVAPNGDLYANTWSGQYYPEGSTPPHPFLIALRDTN